MKKDRILQHYNGFVVLVWLGLWLNFLSQYIQYAPFSEAFAASALFVLLPYPITTYLSTRLMHRAFWKREWKRFVFQFFGCSLWIAALLFVHLLLFIWLERQNVFPGSELFDDGSSLLHNVLNVLLAALFINFGICGLRFFQISLRLQQELNQTRMQTLKSQITPHFMFNVLNHIHVLMQKDVQAADRLLLQYADILRFQLYNADRETVTVKEETEFLQQYLEVEKVRWKNKLDITARWEVQQPGIEIAPLIFITFIENAFKHVARSDREKGAVQIYFRQQQGTVRMEVINTKSRLADRNREKKGLGLDNIRKRLEILYPQRHRLEICETDESYTTRLTLYLNDSHASN